MIGSMDILIALERGGVDALIKEMEKDNAEIAYQYVRGFITLSQAYSELIKPRDYYSALDALGYVVMPSRFNGEKADEEAQFQQMQKDWEAWKANSLCEEDRVAWLEKWVPDKESFNPRWLFRSKEAAKEWKDVVLDVLDNPDLGKSLVSGSVEDIRTVFELQRVCFIPHMEYEPMPHSIPDPKWFPSHYEENAWTSSVPFELSMEELGLMETDIFGKEFHIESGRGVHADFKVIGYEEDWTGRSYCPGIDTLYAEGNVRGFTATYPPQKLRLHCSYGVIEDIEFFNPSMSPYPFWTSYVGDEQSQDINMEAYDKSPVWAEQRSWLNDHRQKIHDEVQKEVHDYLMCFKNNAAMILPFGKADWIDENAALANSSRCPMARLNGDEE